MTNDFAGFGLPTKLMQSITRLQFTKPTPVQAEAIPLALDGRDLLATAQTGTGKTAAFSIPLISRLMDMPEASAIILAPTRELASQIAVTLKQLIPLPTMKTALLIGGEGMPRQFQQLRQNPQIIIGTPGRVNDHLLRGTLKLNNTSFLVLDETDRMLDMGFGVQIEKILQHMPAERQTMLFSATLPPNILKLSGRYLNNPARIAIGTANTPALKVKQESITVGEGDKYATLLQQLEQRTGSIIIFVKTKYGAERLAVKLTREQHEADAIHGDLRQRQRDRVIERFRDEKYRILVATDVAARGLDIPHIEHVINYDLPQSPEDYIHRIGRTGRAGAEGNAVSLISGGDKAKWHAIQRLIDPRAAAQHREDTRGPGSKGGKKPGGSFGKPKPYGKSKPFGKKRFESRDGDFESPAEDRKSGGRREGRPEGRPEGRFEGRPGSRPSGRPGGRPGSRPEGRSEGRAEGRREDRSENRTEGRAEGRSSDRPGDRLGGRPEGRSGSRPGGRPGNRSEGRFGDDRREGRPEGRTEGRSEGRSEGRPSGSRYKGPSEGRSSEGRPAGRSGGRPGGRPGGNSSGRPGGPRGDKKPNRQRSNQR